MTIPVMKPWLGEAEAHAVAETVRSGWVAQRPRVAEFERAVAGEVGAAHGVAVSSCTAALHLALVLLDIGPGDEVIVPSLSFIATANVVIQTGATPVFADIDPSSLNLTPRTVATSITSRTVAVILVHQAGTPADIDGIEDVCRPFGIQIVEDAACALGATYKERPVGGGRHLAALSFHPRKVITTGEGGMLLTSDSDFASRAGRLREHGMDVSALSRHRSREVVLESYGEVGFNYRMTDIQASVGLVQLRRLGAIVARRRELAAAYRELLAEVPGLTMANDPPFGKSNFQSFWVTLPTDFPISRNELLKRMAANGISARRGIMAAHLEPAYAGSDRAGLATTEMVTNRSLVLPLFHEITATQQRLVADLFRKEAGLSASL